MKRYFIITYHGVGNGCNAYGMVDVICENGLYLNRTEIIEKKKKNEELKHIESLIITFIQEISENDYKEWTRKN